MMSGFGRGGSRFFSKGVVDFQKLAFFQVDQIDFLSSTKALKRPFLVKLSAPQAKF